MTSPRLSLDPWVVCEPEVDPAALGVTESLFSLTNGHIGVRATLDEVEPNGFRGTFIAGVHETYPLAYPESAHAHPTQGQAIIAVADATPVRLLVDGVPLDVRSVQPLAHRRSLDLRTGVLERYVRWQTPTGTTIELRSERLVSLVEQSLGAVRFRVRAVDGDAHVVLRSELVLGASPPEFDNGDPRVAEALDHPFHALEVTADASGGALTAATRRTGIHVAAAVQHLVSDGAAIHTEATSEQHVVSSITARLSAGEQVEVIKVFGHLSVTESGVASLLESVRAVVDSGIDRGWEALVADQRKVLDSLWERADVDVDGDDELLQALRYNVFSLFTNTAFVRQAPLGAKGLTGLGYGGHTFWDVEGFITPALSLLFPDAAGHLLDWRASTLDAAQDRARQLSLAGASFVWRTIDGSEASGYWPASTAAMHVNASIARAFWLHANATGSQPERMLEVLVATARLWASLGHTGSDGGWHVFGVTGPDEYTGLVDDNVFTNLMARQNLLRAAEACDAHTAQAGALGVSSEEVAHWRRAAAAVHVPLDERLGVHPMNTGFTAYPEWDFVAERDAYPVQEHHHYLQIYRHQVIKQADLELALWWCRDQFSDDEVAADLEYYEARTVRDSSLSASPQSVVCAQAGHPDLALRYLRESALVDLADLQGDTCDGLHLASVGGTWLAFASGLGGLRQDRDELELAPRLPPQLRRFSFRLTWRGQVLQVETSRDGTSVSLPAGGEPLAVVIDGTPHIVSPDTPALAPLLPATPLRAEPRQPVGRAPRA